MEQELNQLSALSHLSTLLKRELSSVTGLEIHPTAGSVVFAQGDPGDTWHVILKGTVHVHIYGKVRLVFPIQAQADEG